MSEETVFALNVISQKVEQVPARFLDHPTFGPNLRQVRTGKPIINLPPQDEEEAKAPTPPKAKESATGDEKKESK